MKYIKHISFFSIVFLFGSRIILSPVYATACNPTQAGSTFTLNANCSFSELVDGVDAGTGTVNNAKLVIPTDKTLTIGNTQNLAVGTLQVDNGGTVIIPTGGTIHVGAPIWVDENIDNDADTVFGTEGGGNTTISFSQPSGKTRKNTYVAPGSLDCNDANAHIYQSLTVGTDTDQDGYIIGSASESTCVGGSSTISGRTYYKDSSGSYTQLADASKLGVSDCNEIGENANLVWAAGSGYTDGDLDTFTTAAASNYTCFNNTPDLATKASIGTGTVATLTAGQVRASAYGKDCDDANVNLWGNCYGYAGSGLDGGVTISSNLQLDSGNPGSSTDRNGSWPDGWNTNVTAFSISNGKTTATVTSNPTEKIVVGDEVLVISVQGTTSAYANVGNYETFIVDAVSSNSVTFTRPKIRYYGSGASDDNNLGTTKGTNQIIVLQRIPHYTSLTVSSGITLYANGYTGNTKYGIVAFRTTGNTRVNGYISTSGLGFSGASQYGNRTYSGGGGGEAYCGLGGNGAAGCNAASTSCTGIGAISTTGAGGGGGAYGYTYTNSLPGRAGACGGGGGGGGYNGSGGASGSNIGGAGGGGGGHGGGGGGAGYGGAGYGGGKGAYSVATASNGSNGSGSQSGSGGNGATGGYGEGGGGGGGGTYGTANLSKLYFGSGGGRGGVYSGTPGAGGSGGGIIFIGTGGTLFANLATNQIISLGSAASNGSGTNAGGGGGGSGGSILLYANTFTLTNNSIVGTGGTAGAYSGGSGGNGGNGGVGRVALYSPNAISGTTNPTYSTAVSFSTYSP